MRILTCLVEDHNLLLVLLAAAICVAGSWKSIRLLNRIRTRGEGQKTAWLFMGTVAGGARTRAPALWSVATRRPAQGLGGGRGVELDIVAAAGAPVAKVTGLALRASTPATLFRSADSAARDWSRWLYVPVWREAVRRRAHS